MPVEDDVSGDMIKKDCACVVSVSFGSDSADVASDNSDVAIGFDAMTFNVSLGLIVKF